LITYEVIVTIYRAVSLALRCLDEPLSLLVLLLSMTTSMIHWYSSPFAQFEADSKG
jgi:hypothetical protein